MKKFLSSMFAVTLFISCFFSCNHPETSLTPRLTLEELIAIKDFQKANLSRTRVIIDDTTATLVRVLPKDTSFCEELPIEILGYIDIYSNDFQNIDEDELLNTIYLDPLLSDDNKIHMAEALGNAAYLKENMEIISVQTSRKDCLETWKKETKALMKKFLIQGSLCLLRGDTIGLAAVTAIAWAENDAALDNYNKCTAEN